MAAAMKLFRLAQQPRTCLLTQVRWWRKKPRPPWTDPKNMSWAEPLFERQRQQQQEGEGEQPQASPLHLVIRTKPLAGRPHWEKDMMKKLGLGDRVTQMAVHKNTPAVNKMLLEVKHLVKIVPVSLPNGLPQDEADFEHCVMRDNGQFVLTPRLDPAQVSVCPEKQEDHHQRELESSTLERAARRKLERHALSSEYFPAVYRYKYNQDKKESRYSGNLNIGRGRTWW